MKLIQPFDATQFDPTQGVGQLPIGKHAVIIESSEVKPNKTNDGGYLQLNLKTQDGLSGAMRLSLYHNNPQTVQIAHNQLSAVSHAVGVFKFDDSSALHNIPFLVEVGAQKKQKPDDPDYTEVKRVFDIHGNEPGRTPANNGAAAQPQPQPRPQTVGWAQNGQDAGAAASSAPAPATGGGWQQNAGNGQLATGGSVPWGKQG